MIQSPMIFYYLIVKIWAWLVNTMVTNADYRCMYIVYCTGPISFGLFSLMKTIIQFKQVLNIKSIKIYKYKSNIAFDEGKPRKIIYIFFYGRAIKALPPLPSRAYWQSEPRRRKMEAAKKVFFSMAVPLRPYLPSPSSLLAVGRWDLGQD